VWTFGSARPTTTTYAVNVSVPFAKVDANTCNARGAGPFSTAPDVEYLEPWHGHTYCEDSKPLTVQSACVHVAVRTVNEASPVLDARNSPIDVLMSAAVPTDASVPEVGIVTDTTRPETDPFNVESCGAFPGEFGLLQALINVPAAASEAAWHASAQN
jgi:hypothetical protein